MSFQKVANVIANKEGLGLASARAILAKSSPLAKKKNPSLLKVKGSPLKLPKSPTVKNSFTLGSPV